MLVRGPANLDNFSGEDSRLFELVLVCKLMNRLKGWRRAVSVSQAADAASAKETSDRLIITTRRPKRVRHPAAVSRSIFFGSSDSSFPGPLKMGAVPYSAAPPAHPPSALTESDSASSRSASQRLGAKELPAAPAHRDSRTNLRDSGVEHPARPETRDCSILSKARAPMYRD